MRVPVVSIVNGVKPFARPPTSGRREDALWRLFDSSWALVPAARPSAQEYMETIQGMNLPPTTPPARSRSSGRVGVIFTDRMARQILTF